MTTPSKQQMVLNFKDNDVRLFDQLRESARRNRRSLTSEVLFRIEQTFTTNSKQEV